VEAASGVALDEFIATEICKPLGTGVCVCVCVCVCMKCVYGGVYEVYVWVCVCVYEVCVYECVCMKCVDFSFL
jgi:hypothetical protein